MPSPTQGSSRAIPPKPKCRAARKRGRRKPSPAKAAGAEGNAGREAHHQGQTEKMSGTSPRPRAEGVASSKPLFCPDNLFA